MNKIKILSKKEKQEILNKLQEQFGITNIPGYLVKIGKERIYLFQANIHPQIFNEIKEITRVEKAGAYVGKELNNFMRLSIEGTQLFKNQIIKNIFELNEEQAQHWMQGEELNIETGKKEILVMKYENDFLGCGKASEKKITNFIPKNRRLKSKTII